MELTARRESVHFRGVHSPPWRGFLPGRRWSGRWRPWCAAWTPAPGSARSSTWLSCRAPETTGPPCSASPAAPRRLRSPPAASHLWRQPVGQVPIIGRFRKHKRPQIATWYVIIGRGLSRRCCLRRYWRENGVTGPQKQGVSLRASEKNSLRCERRAPATSRLTGSRAQAIPRHITSRFGVALRFLNLPNTHVKYCTSKAMAGVADR